MLKRLVLSVAVLGFLVVPAFAQQGTPSRRAAPAPKPVSPAAQYDSAYYGWIAGNYPDALQRIERLLNAPGSEAFLDSAALLTGELFLTREVAPDGNTPRWSSNSKTAGFISGTGAERRVRLVDVSGAALRETATFPGTGLVFSPTRNEVAYFAVDETDALRAARAAVDSATRAQDFQGANRARSDVARLEAEASRVRVRDLATGQERDVPTPGLTGLRLWFGRDGSLYLTSGVPGDPTTSNIYAIGPAGPRPITEGARAKNFVGASATHVVYSTGTSVPGWLTIVVRKLGSTESQQLSGRQPAISADGTTLAYVSVVAGDTTLNVVTLATGGITIARQGTSGIANPSLSSDGKLVAYQVMLREDWEIHVVSGDGTNDLRVTRDAQDDFLPQFLGTERLLILKGEGRHRRSYVYDIAAHRDTRLFHNNTVRTVSPEYEWAVSPDATRVLIVADRDGDTISPERGVYLMDLTRKVTAPQLMDRVKASLAVERELRARGTQMFSGIATRVRPVVADVSAARIYTYSRALFEMDSRWIAKPGNLKAIEYFIRTLTSWGYEPEVQWFEPRPGVRTANVIATLKGTRFPDRIYIISAHFDSVERTAGSDDDGTGTTALLEAARVMAGRPQPATIKFAFLTGEEAGTLGSREFVRRSVAAGDKISGVLNNDMGGWMEDGRLDDTIRYSSAHVRDVQHSAAFLFTNLITYDAKYYRGTDAGPFFDAYGEITGGIGGYPILASPHYHETHDVLETISPQLISEIAKTSVASIMLMAQQPELPKKPAT